jgi:hypothetical protein
LFFGWQLRKVKTAGGLLKESLFEDFESLKSDILQLVEEAQSKDSKVDEVRKRLDVFKKSISGNSN